MFVVTLRVLAQAFVWAIRAYFAHWRVTVPGTLGAAFGLWWASWLSGFGIDRAFTEPLSLPKPVFKIVFVILFGTVFAIAGNGRINTWFPPGNGTTSR